MFCQPFNQAAKWGPRFRSALESLLKKVRKKRTQSEDKFLDPPHLLIFCGNKCNGKLHIVSATVFKPCLLAEGQGAGIGKEDNTIDQQFGQSNKEPLLDATIKASIVKHAPNILRPAMP